MWMFGYITIELETLKDFAANHLWYIDYKSPIKLKRSNEKNTQLLCSKFIENKIYQEHQMQKFWKKNEVSLYPLALLKLVNAWHF